MGGRLVVPGDRRGRVPVPDRSGVRPVGDTVDFLASRHGGRGPAARAGEVLLQHAGGHRPAPLWRRGRRADSKAPQRRDLQGEGQGFSPAGQAHCDLLEPDRHPLLGLHGAPDYQRVGGGHRRGPGPVPGRGHRRAGRPAGRGRRRPRRRARDGGAPGLPVGVDRRDGLAGVPAAADYLLQRRLGLLPVRHTLWHRPEHRGADIPHR